MMNKAYLFVPYTARAGARVEGRSGLIFHYYVVIRGSRLVLRNMFAVAQILEYVTAECDDFSMEIRGDRDEIDINLTFLSGRICETRDAIGRALLDLGFDSVEICTYRGAGITAQIVGVQEFTPAT